DYNIDGVAKVTGSATFSVGNTGQQSNETVLQMGATQDTPTVLQIDDDLDNMEFYGSDLEAKFKNRTDKEYNIQWNAVDSELNSTKDKGSFLISTHENSANNTFKLGLADNVDVSNYVVDSGKNNTFFSAEKSANYFETTETSIGANIYAGNGQNNFLIGGSEGFVVGGSANDLFITADTSSKNILAGMKGNDAFADYGKQNLILGGAGNDSLEVGGEKGLANLGFGEDYTVDIKSGANDNAIFTGKKLTASDLTNYNYEEFLQNYLENTGITMAEFMARAELSKNASPAEIIRALKGQL
ncbi:MAG: hypothetical protein ACI37T_07780, partial [Candidatus Gastranaerophilaceae bacterium]